VSVIIDVSSSQRQRATLTAVSDDEEEETDDAVEKVTKAFQTKPLLEAMDEVIATIVQVTH
jgi:uncharacterized protein YpiB (UPF0302 family)